MMSDVQQKILGIIKTPALATLATITEDNKPWARYVMIQAQDDMRIRFATYLHSRKVQQIRANPEVHLTCGSTGEPPMQQYLQIQGKAEVSTDESEKTAYWNDELKNYFTDPDDPNYAVVIVKPYRIEFQTHSEKPAIWEA